MGESSHGSGVLLCLCAELSAQAKEQVKCNLNALPGVLQRIILLHLHIHFSCALACAVLHSNSFKEDTS